MLLTHFPDEEVVEAVAGGGGDQQAPDWKISRACWRSPLTTHNHVGKFPQKPPQEGQPFPGDEHLASPPGKHVSLRD